MRYNVFIILSDGSSVIYRRNQTEYNAKRQLAKIESLGKRGKMISLGR